MARAICIKCRRKITANRSSHLRKEHGIDTYKGAVADYFLTPEQLGLTADEFEQIKEGKCVEGFEFYNNAPRCQWEDNPLAKEE